MTSDDPEQNSSARAADIQRMFNAIAPTYDLLNHLLSFGLDIRWRKRAVTLLEEKRGGAILDIAAGSGDFTLEVLSIQPGTIVATDFATTMLRVFRHKLDTRPAGPSVDLLACDALSLPFRDGSFDATMVGFGIRNFTDRLLGLREMFRVLKPGGIALVLELTQPKQPIVRELYNFYSRFALPVLGTIISRDRNAYHYLPDSIARFPDRKEFLSLMADAGFSDTQAFPLTFGAATIFVGRKGAGFEV